LRLLSLSEEDEEESVAAAAAAAAATVKPCCTSVGVEGCFFLFGRESVGEEEEQAKRVSFRSSQKKGKKLGQNSISANSR